MMEFRPIEPLWDSLSQPAQPAGQNPAGSLFASVFQSAIQNVRDTDAQQVELEYQLATGQIDNPALVTTAASKASTAALLLMEMRNKAVDTYNELMRISL